VCGIVIRRSQVRILPGVLSLSVASRRTSSPKSAIAKGLGDSSCADGFTPSSQPVATVRSVWRPDCCAWCCAPLKASASSVPVAASPPDGTRNNIVRAGLGTSKPASDYGNCAGPDGNVAGPAVNSSQLGTRQSGRDPAPVNRNTCPGKLGPWAGELDSGRCRGTRAPPAGGRSWIPGHRPGRSATSTSGRS